MNRKWRTTSESAEWAGMTQPTLEYCDEDTGETLGRISPPGPDGGWVAERINEHGKRDVVVVGTKECAMQYVEERAAPRSDK